MSEQEVKEVEQEQVQQVEVDPDHPYVQASFSVHPEPTECAVKIEGMTLTIGQGEGAREVPAAEVTIVTTSGVTVIYLTPKQLASMLINGSEVLELFRPKESGLVVADEQDMKVAVAVEKKIKGKGKK